MRRRENEEDEVDLAQEEIDERIDLAVAESFPASDPPPWTLGPPAWSKRRDECDERTSTVGKLRTVKDVMEPHVRWLPSDMPLERAAEELASRQISGAPVCAPDGRIVGMLSITDLAEYYGGSHELRLVREVMTPEVLAVGPDDPIARAIQIMAFEGVHRLLVVDRDDRLMGIVTSMDVLRELAGFPRQHARVFAVAPPI